jgi:hypothetical protein
VLSIDLGSGAITTFASGLDFVGGIAVDPATGDVYVAESLATFDNQITRFASDGTPLATPFAGPSFAFGSIELLLTPAGTLLAGGAFGGDVIGFDLASANSAPFISGLTYASALAVDPFTGRFDVLSSTFSGAAEDRSLHRFTPVDRLEPGSGRGGAEECLHEFYGVELVASAPGRKPRHAICVDGAACDADGTADGVCRFPLGLCLGVEDPRLAACAGAATISELTVKTRPVSIAIADTAATIAGALPVTGPTCRFSDGFALPLRRKRNGDFRPATAKVVVTAESTDGRVDRDSLRLRCEPSAG